MPAGAYADENKSPLDGVLSLFGVDTQAEEGQWAVDPDTHDEWYSADGTGVSDQGGDSTKNTGRVWTDKSVYNSDVQLTSQSGENTFTVENDEGTALVGLSALSSAANISGQTTINQPLDIILVLDRSGSMTQGGFSSYSYTEEYNPDERRFDGETYYVQNSDGSYSAIEERHGGLLTGFRFEGWYLNGTQVWPKTGPNDNDPSHVQFYTRERDSYTTYASAMESAVTNFIDRVATENVGKTSEDQHRVSIVSYSEGADAYSTENWRDTQYFINCTEGTNANNLKRYVTDLNYLNGTETDEGFDLAENIMNGGTSGRDDYGDGARDDAKKVVIFFTDGMPGDGDYVENTHAGPTVNTAYTMKQSGTTIYTVGVFEGVDPDDLSGDGTTTHDANYFMNAVSNNYPNAQSRQTGQNVDFSDNCTLGDRAEGDYFFAADSAEGLNEVFNSIYDDFGTGATSPIKTETSIGGNEVGYLTFTDTLGDYMEVKNFKSIIFAGQEFTQVSSQENDSSTTYTFQGTVNNGNADGEVYPGSHDLSNIQITVEHDADLQQGDVVTVKIPSNLIPLRLYTAESETVDGDTTTTTSVKDAYPIRVYYTVGLKDDIMDGSNVDASKLDSSYIESHTDEDGNVYFYSNSYTSGDAGTTTAEFTPAETNSFYYFTENTPIYTAENANSPVRDYRIGQTYYYQRTFYADNDVQTEWVSFVAGQGQLGNYVQLDNESNTYYIEEGSPRLTRATEFVADKADTTITETANKAISPSWAGSVVSVALGNNGKIAYPVSGSLQISKNVDWGTTGVTHNDKDFEYTVDLGGTDTQVEGNFDYIKYNAQGQPLDGQDQPQALDEGAQPAATGQISDGGTVSLSNGEYVVINNLPANTEFSVTEADAAGYTAANTVDGTQSQDGKVAVGTIASNDTVEVAYTNTYSVQPTSLAEGSLHGAKVLNDRDWKEGESFTFTLTPTEETSDAPLPGDAEDQATVTLTNDNGNDYKDGEEVPFNFGEIEFTTAGKFIYLIQETEGDEYGLECSNAVYRITVNVTDDGAGNLSASVESVYRTFNDNGTSTGNNEDEWASIEDGKALFTNNFKGDDVDIANITGTKKFVNHTTGDGLVVNQFSFTLEPVTAGAPMPDNAQATNRGDASIVFDDITFGIDDIGKTYEYQIKENVPAGASDNGDGTATLNGMTFDTTTKTVSIAVTQDQETGSVVATVTGNGFEFNNSYQASSVTTDGANDGLQITKTLDGAAGTDGQFEFKLSAADDDTKAAIANGWITGGSFAADNVETADTNEAVTETVKTTSAIEKDGSQNITFDNLTFTHPGTYSFNVTETQNAPNDKWNYDDHTYSVTYTVTDNNGQLEIAEPVIAGSSTFVNTYTVSMDYDNAAGGVLFSKTLNGRALEANQFDFTVTTSDDASAAKLAEATQTLSNRYGAADGAAAQWRGIAGLTFDQDDVNQTFTFVVGETNAGADGYTYDDKSVTVAIKVNDEGGKLTTETTVTKQGEEPVVYNSNDFQQGDSSTYPTAAFANSYSASDTDAVSVEFKKQLTGRNWKGTDHFEFTLTPDTNNSTVSEEVLNAAYKGTEEDKTAEVEGSNDSKTFSFGSFQFSETGTYVYNVNEIQPEEGTDTQGISYDKTTAIVTFTVTDPGTGKLAVDSSIGGVRLTDDGAGIFVNNYTYEPASLEQGTDTGIGVKKTVTGATNTEDFSFTATFNAEASANAAADAEAEAGVAENIEGLTDGSLQTTISEDFNAGDTKASDFGTLTFNEPGVYVFDVVENNQKSDGGWNYDTETHQITVTVEDNTEGELVATVTGNDPEFVNSYVPGSVTVGDDEDNLQVTKEVTGAPALSDFEFTLKLTSNNADGVEGLDENNSLTASTNGLTDKEGDEAKQTVEFMDLTFTKAGDYTFQVVENTTTDAPGWTYASREENAKTITVKVTDDFTGQLVATTVVDGNDTNNPTFTNSYKAEEVTTGDDAETGIQVTKKVTGHDAIEAFEFSLSLKDAQNADVVFEGKGENKTAFDGMTATTSNGIKNGAAETKTFDDITFTAEGDYTFMVDETTEKTDGGWTYDTDTEEVTVHVKDDGKGKLYIDSIDNNAPTFENIYKLQPAMFRAAKFQLQGNKVLDGRDWEAGDEFTFTLTAGRGDNLDGSTMADGEVTATMPSSTSDTIRPADGDGSKVTDNSAQFTFTDERYPGEDIVGNEDDVFTYTKPGTYRYLIRETNPNVSDPGSGILGVSYDQTVYRLTVEVTDNGDGTMSAEGSYTKRNTDGTWTDLNSSNEVIFTNKYSSDEIDVTFNAFKVLQNRDQNMTDGEFTFHMEFAGWATNDANADPADDSAWTMDDTTNAPEAAEDIGNIIRGDVTFGEMAFTKDNVGYTYRYKITENAGAVPGVTYDENAHYVTAKVTSVSMPDDPQDPDGAYTEHVRVETSGEAEWNEETGTAPTDGAIFTNTYEAGAATGVPANFKLTKKFIGHEWTDDYSFEFTLAAQDSEFADGTPIAAADVPMPASTTKTVNAPDAGSTDTATFDFGSISYDKAGTYKYIVTETNAGNTDDGITYDEQSAEVTVTVTEGKDASGALTGQLVATATVTNGDFVNEYHASADYDAQGVGGLDITKQLNNRNMTADQFAFTIEATGDNAADAAKKLGIAEGTTTTVKNTAGNAGEPESVVGNPFDNITFDETDSGKTYTYTIKEEGTSGEGDYAGYTLDDTTYTVSIMPSDNGDGTMSVTTDVNGTKYTDQRATAAFENTYKADDVTVGTEGAAQIKANKTLKNDDIANYDGEFKFQVTSGDVVVATGTNDKNGNIAFDDITYTTENLAEAATEAGSDTVGKASLDPSGDADVYIFTYSVSEVTNDLPGGVTYISGAANVTVKVTDDRHGKLTVEVEYTGDATSVEFVNTYGAGTEGSTELNLKGNKEIVAADGLTEHPELEDGAFIFEITGQAASDGTPAPMPEDVTATNQNGEVKFGPITFTMENVFGNTAATQDETDAVTEENENSSAESTDSESAESEDDTATNDPSDEETVTENADNADTSAETVTAGVTSSDEGISAQTAGRTKTFTYIIKETAGDVAGVDNDTSEKKVKVTVTDEGEGKISVGYTKANGADEGNDFTFTNVYNVDPQESSLTGDGGFTVAKNLTTNTDRALNDGEFKFQLTDADGKVVSEGVNDADGKVEMPAVKFTEPGDYTYTLEELNNQLGGVDYDPAKYTVIAHVTDRDVDGNYTGTLAVTWEMQQATDNKVEFNNTYTAQPTSVSLGTGKLIKGRDLSAGEFTFKLADADGNEVSTATNEEDGAVTFDTITYDQAGTYNYTITEVAPEDTDPNTEGIQNNGVTYDESVYNVTVEVTDNSKGNLNAEVSYDTENGSAPLFVNAYTAPAEPEQGGDGEDGGLFGMAKTGDFTGGIFAAIAALVAAAVGGAAYAFRRMRRPRGRHAR